MGNIHKICKGQAGTEYLIVISIGLFLLTPVIILGQQSMSHLREESDYLMVRESLNKLSDASKIVHSQGYPAKISIRVKLPDTLESSYILNNAVVFRISNSAGFNDLIEIFDFNVTGALPSSGGIYTINVEALQNEVNISIV